jgi:predicted RNA-binding Zn-ribbon protein involved in translation (DUF1610 family)
MARSIWTTEEFACPGCGTGYVATREEHEDKRSGSFKCNICGAEVHAWSGYHHFFDWKANKTSAPGFGKRK